MFEVDVTDLFAGYGGASTGAIDVPGVKIKIAANHDPHVIEVHNLNHPETDHACVDLHFEDPAFFPKTLILWASPECKTWSQGGGQQPALSKALGDMTLFDQIDEELFTTEEDEATRSRLLMFDVLRFIDHHRYAGVIVENVVDIATNPKYATAWRAWQQGLINLGYEFKVVSLNSMHAQALGDPAPQSRDRLYVVAWPKGSKPPEIEKFIRPRAWCDNCEGVVESKQAWKNGRTIGKYRTQYVYHCADCDRQVEPAWLPASSAIDWTVLGERIGSRKKPLAKKTLARIAAGIARYWGPLIVEANGNTYDAADPKHKNHGNPNAYYRAFPVEEPLKSLVTDATKAIAAPPFMLERRFEYRTRPLDEPLSTLTAVETTKAIVGPPFIAEMRGGGSDARSTAEPLGTVTAGGNHHALVTPYFSASKSAKPVTDPFGTFTTHDRCGLVMRNNSSKGEGAEMSTPTDEAFRTFTTKGHQSLVTPGDLAAAEAMVDDCTFRMLQPPEIGRGMAFPADYIVQGTKAQQVSGYGNAVTPPAARDLVGAVVESLGFPVAA